MQMDEGNEHFTISDRHGLEYQVVSTRIGELVVFKIRGGVGRANCLVYSELMLLQDLQISENAMYHRKWRVPLLMSKTRQINCRRMGIGSAFLELMKEYAKMSGVRRIEGKVKSKDFGERPWLPDWYQKRGFTVIRHPPNTGIIADIFIELD